MVFVVIGRYLWLTQASGIRPGVASQSVLRNRKTYTLGRPDAASLEVPCIDGSNGGSNRGPPSGLYSLQGMHDALCEICLLQCLVGQSDHREIDHATIQTERCVFR